MKCAFRWFIFYKYITMHGAKRIHKHSKFVSKKYKSPEEVDSEHLFYTLNSGIVHFLIIFNSTKECT